MGRYTYFRLSLVYKKETRLMNVLWVDDEKINECTVERVYFSQYYNIISTYLPIRVGQKTSSKHLCLQTTLFMVVLK